MITYSFAGLGLIGGSLAKAIRVAFGKEAYIQAYDTDPKTLHLASSEGVIDVSFSTLCEALADCDYLFLCGPVQKNIENLYFLKDSFPSKCLITDVSSVKTPIHEAVKELGLEASFLGGHPMAGSEKSGYANTSQRLLENAYYVLTTANDSPTERLNDYQNLIRAIGGIPLVLSYEEHDYATAAISHLPHIIASSLVNLIESADSEQETMKLIAAGGFKDITRIASSDPSMWQQISLMNHTNLQTLLNAYIQNLTALAKQLSQQDGNGLFSFFEAAKHYRDSIPNASSGAFKKVHSFYVDIPDETGMIASIATLLSKQQISMKNIGIIHNREFEEGVLRIELYEEDTCQAAQALLLAHGYLIYEKK